MSERFFQFIVLADGGRISELGSGFRGKGARLEIGDLVLWGLGLVGVVAVAWLLAKLLAWRDGRGARNSPRALFRGLCKVHSLDRRQRSLLRQLARVHRLAHPAILFVEPQRLYPGENSPVPSSQVDALAVLRQRLFGDAV